MTDAEIKAKGYQALIDALGTVGAAYFVAMVQREGFDYTEWQRNLWPDKTIEQISHEAMEMRPRIPTNRPPTHPGEMLLEEFLNPMGLTQRDLADAVGVPYQRINEIINGRRGITPATALRLAKFLGTSPDFWMNLQQRWDLYHAQRDEGDVLKSIQRYSKVGSH